MIKLNSSTINPNVKIDWFIEKILAILNMKGNCALKQTYRNRVIKMKKFTAFFAAVLFAVFCLTGCSGGTSSGTGEISVLYYTFSDTYISSVRAGLDKILSDAGLNYNDYDANSSQTTQTEQVHTAIAKGSSMLIVNVVDTGSNDAAQNIVNLAKAQNIPVIFFNRSVDESVVTSYEKCVFVGTDYEMAGHMQGEMIGNYLLQNYDNYDLNKDGKISYVMFKGQEGNLEAIARTKYAVEDCNSVLQAAGKPAIEFYDTSNANKYLVDQDGNWSSAAATNYMSTILARHSTAGNNMVELVIANNDEMALGAVSALQSAGYNKGSGSVVIPVFGIDATDAAKAKIADGSMAGTIKQDGEGMAQTIKTIIDNFKSSASPLSGLDTENTVGSWRVNVPYSVFTGE